MVVTPSVTMLSLMAMGGWVSNHGIPGVPPVQTGGRLHEYTIGAYAACAALTAVRAGGAVPAVTAVLDGTVRLGLSDDEHERIEPLDGPPHEIVRLAGVLPRA